MVDITGVNSYAIYKCNKTRDYQQPKRSDFLRNLSFFLVEDHLRERMNNGRLPREMRDIICNILKYEDDEP